LPTAERFECLTDVRTTATALWGDQPKELVLWLEEVVLATKEMEQYVLLRVVNGTDPPQALNYARRHRLKAEAELWKVKNAQ
jgi:hypothetical protein